MEEQGMNRKILSFPSIEIKSLCTQGERICCAYTFKFTLKTKYNYSKPALMEQEEIFLTISFYFYTKRY